MLLTSAMASPQSLSKGQSADIPDNPKRFRREALTIRRPNEATGTPMKKFKASTDTFSSLLLDLPEVPLLRIMRYLDEKSLKEAKLMCKSLFSFIDANRTQMAATPIYRVIFRRERQKDGEDYVRVAMQKCASAYNRSCKVLYFPVLAKERETTTEDPMRQKSRERTFSEWISSQFFNIAIEILEMNQMHFRCTDFVHLESAFRTNNVRASTVELRNSIDSTTYVDNVMRIVMAVSPEWLFLHENDPENRRFLTTPSFFNCISTLKMFSNIRGPFDVKWTVTALLPSDFYKFPPIFEMGPGLILNIFSLRKALQEWYQDRLIIRRWQVILPAEYESEKLLCEGIGLLYEFDNWGCLGIENDAGRKVFLMRDVPDGFHANTLRNARVCCWTIA